MVPVKIIPGPFRIAFVIQIFDTYSKLLKKVIMCIIHQ